MKKGVFFTLENLIKLILVALVVVFLLVPLFSWLYGLFAGEKTQIDKASVEGLKTIKAEIDLMVDEEVDKTEIIIPIFLKKGYIISSFNYNQSDRYPKGCKDKSCLYLWFGEETRHLAVAQFSKDLTFTKKKGNIVVESDKDEIRNVRIVVEKKDSKYTVTIE
jgi:uncharacterized protein YpmB